jgi:hypothetical protein
MSLLDKAPKSYQVRCALGSLRYLNNSNVKDKTVGNVNASAKADQDQRVIMSIPNIKCATRHFLWHRAMRAHNARNTRLYP